MTDDRYEDELRSQIHAAARGKAGGPLSPAEAVDADQMLARVRRGARRRRARRTAVGAVAATAMVVAGVAVVPALLAQDTPVAGSGDDLSDASVQTVAVAGETIWATVRGSCGDEPCRALARSADGGRSWSFTSTADTAALPATASHVELAASTPDGWAWTSSGDLAATHDGGTTWTDAAIGSGSQVDELAAGSEQAVALVSTAETQQLVASPVGGDDWQPVDAPVSGTETLYGVFAGGDTYGAVVESPGPQATLVVGAGDDGWQRRDLPCGGESNVFADTSGAIVWAACLGGRRTVVANSTDGGSWETADLPSLRGRVAMTARDGSVLLAAADDAYRVTTGYGSDQVQRVEPQDEIGAATDADAEELGGFGDAGSGEADWLVGADGTLLSSTDAGASWHPVPVD